MLDHVKPSVCLDILNHAAAGRGVCVRRISAKHETELSDLLGALADLTLAGVIRCEATAVAGFVSLALGPKAVQAVFLFALNCDDAGALPTSGQLSACAVNPAIESSVEAGS